MQPVLHREPQGLVEGRGEFQQRTAAGTEEREARCLRLHSTRGLLKETDVRPCHFSTTASATQVNKPVPFSRFSSVF